MGNHPDATPGWADVELVAFPGSEKREPRGRFSLEIYSAAGILGRTINAEVIDAEVSSDGSAVVLGRVVSDERTGGHGSQDTGHEEPGHEPGSDGGHDTGHEEPGHEPGGGSTGHHLGGSDRVGQLVALRVVDGGSPGTRDVLSWKWFAPDALTIHTVPSISALCAKTITDGNLVVHIAKA